MNPSEIKTKWIEALRSGKYKQGNGRLRTTTPEGNKEYCCLGVLCDIVDSRAWETGMFGNRWYGETTYPPISLFNQLGLNPQLGRELARLNDIAQWNFNQIADTIERLWKVDDPLDKEWVELQFQMDKELGSAGKAYNMLQEIK